ncbi:Probable enoyl-CoA hydratase echA8 [Geodia barretti]|uniref:3-hydroxyisobutyryl-CoA hydrolase n=1 Tax=Geodia barretti TaxID=519541 RepID=A0AA35TU10_GEOBA|nr:Probable enoyl-CoA hydratase echA8 [Geodia barretti]
MNLETMLYESDGDLIRLTLNRPQALNAVNYRGVVELLEAAQAIHDDPTARAVLIRGAGRAFCSGIDLKELAAGETPTLTSTTGTGHYGCWNCRTSWCFVQSRDTRWGAGCNSRWLATYELPLPTASWDCLRRKRDSSQGWGRTGCRGTSGWAGPSGWRFRARTWTDEKRCASAWWTTWWSRTASTPKLRHSLNTTCPSARRGLGRPS